MIGNILSPDILKLLLESQGQPQAPAGPLGLPPNLAALIQKLKAAKGDSSADAETQTPVAEPYSIGNEANIQQSINADVASLGDITKQEQNIGEVNLDPKEALPALLAGIFGGRAGRAAVSGYVPAVLGRKQRVREKLMQGLAQQREDTRFRIQSEERQLSNAREDRQFNQQLRLKGIEDEIARIDKLRTRYNTANTSTEKKVVGEEMIKLGLISPEQVDQEVFQMNNGSPQDIRKEIGSLKKDIVSGKYGPKTVGRYLEDFDRLQNIMQRLDPNYRVEDSQALAEAGRNEFQAETAKGVNKFIGEQNAGVKALFTATQGLNEKQVAGKIKEIASLIESNLKNNPQWAEAGWTKEQLLSAMLNPGDFEGPSRSMALRLNQFAETQSWHQELIKQFGQRFAQADEHFWATYSRVFENDVYGEPTNPYNETRKKLGESESNRDEAAVKFKADQAVYNGIAGEYDKAVAAGLDTSEIEKRMAEARDKMNASWEVFKAWRDRAATHKKELDGMTPPEQPRNNAPSNVGPTRGPGGTIQSMPKSQGGVKVNYTRGMTKEAFIRANPQLSETDLLRELKARYGGK